MLSYTRVSKIACVFSCEYEYDSNFYDYESKVYRHK